MFVANEMTEEIGAGKALGQKKRRQPTVTVGFQMIDQVGFSLISFSALYSTQKHHLCFSEMVFEIILPSSTVGIEGCSY